MIGRACPRGIGGRLEHGLLSALLAFTALLMLAGSPGAAAANVPQVVPDGVVARAWLDDPDSSLTARTALEGSWTPFEGTLGRGFTAGTTWMRLSIDPSRAGPALLSGDNRLVLRIWPSHLDEIAVFRVRSPESPRRVLGDTVDPVSRPDRALAYRVVFQDATAPFEVLLRLRSTSNHSLGVQALRWEDAARRDTVDLLKAAVFLTFTLGSILVACVAWIMRRDGAVAIFVMFQFTAMVLAAALLGVLRLLLLKWIDAELLDRLTSMTIPVWGGFLALFHARLLQDFGARKKDVALLRSLLIVPMFALLLFAIGHVREGLHICQLMHPILMFMLVLVALRVDGNVGVGPRRWSSRPRVYLVGAYGLMALIAVPQFLRVLGLYSFGPASFDGFMVYGVVTTLLFGGLLIYRARDSARERRETERELTDASMQVAVEAARNAEQTEMLEMLVHELKTPLSVLSLTIDEPGLLASTRDRALRAVQNMKMVIERCAQVAHFQQSYEKVGAGLRHEPVALPSLLEEAVSLQPGAARIDSHVENGALSCRSDRQLLLLILGNLLENALKYSPVDGRVQLTLTAAERDGRPGVCVAVVNEVGRAGRPNPARMFRKYHREDAARYQAGSGLGLYLSRQFAARIGATLALVDADQVRFELWIPA